MGVKSANLMEEDGHPVKVIHHERVAQAKREAISEKELHQLALTYRVLGDPTRLRMALALRGGEMCVCDLAALLGLSESAVSHQIRRLRDLALVKSRREGQMRYYSLDDLHIVDLLRVGMDHLKE